MKELKICVIGAGERVCSLLGGMRDLAYAPEIVGCLDRSPENARKNLAKYEVPSENVAFFENVDAMIDACAPDGVVIGTPCAYHTEYAVAVMRRNSGEDTQCIMPAARTDRATSTIAATQSILPCTRR